MKRVLVVGSVHTPMGQAKAEELYWLLGRLKPEVIFLEHSAAVHTAFLSGTWRTLEAAAVRRFVEDHPDTKLVPVDVLQPAAELRAKFDALFDRIDVASPRSAELHFENCRRTEIKGFAYLNSPLQAALETAMRAEQKIAVDAIADPTITEALAHWTRTHDQREIAMLKEIESYASHSSFTKGVLIVGAAHRQSIFEKSLRLQEDGTLSVTWDFEWQHEVMALSDVASSQETT